jgi:hypothetical protein
VDRLDSRARVGQRVGTEVAGRLLGLLDRGDRVGEELVEQSGVLETKRATTKGMECSRWGMIIRPDYVVGAGRTRRIRAGRAICVHSGAGPTDLGAACLNALVRVWAFRGWPVRLALVGLVAVGLGVAFPGVGLAAGDVPVISFSGVARCSDQIDGSVGVGWTVSQDTIYGGTFVSLSSSPEETLHANTNVLAGKAPAIVNLTIPYDPSLHTASLTVTVDFDLPGGHQVITATGSISLPHCPRRVAPSVTVNFGPARAARRIASHSRPS